MREGFAPCLPTKVDTAPTGEHWIHEIKHDGLRLIARKAEGRVQLLTKKGHDWADRFPLIVRAVMRLRAKSIVIDGEALCFTDGREDFDKLRGQHNAVAVLCAFDLLELGGDDWRGKMLIERKARLRKALDKCRPGLRYVDHIMGHGPDIFEHACKLGLEGIVSKRADLPYRPGPSRTWLKSKNREHPSVAGAREAFERTRR